MSLKKYSSLSMEDLTPIVLSYLQNANKTKNRRGQQSKKSINYAKNNGDVLKSEKDGIRKNELNKMEDKSGDESSSEESNKRSAEAFMAGIQSALQSKGQAHESSSKSCLSKELVSEVQTVLSKLMHSVEKDTDLVTLIRTLQVSLNANLYSEEDKNQPTNTLTQVRSTVKLTQSDSSSMSSEDVSGSTKYYNLVSANFQPSQNKKIGVKESLKSPKYSVSLSEISAEVYNMSFRSYIPWKIRATRKRSIKHTNGMTKEEFRKVKEALKLSAKKMNMKPTDKNELCFKNKSASDIRNSTPFRDRDHENWNDFENFHKSTDLGYASDVCDYNASKNYQLDEKSNKTKKKKYADSIQQDQFIYDNFQSVSVEPKTNQEESKAEVNLSVPCKEGERIIYQQSSTEDERSVTNKSKSASAVKAKIARRKNMKKASALESPQGSFSDQEIKCNEEEEGSVEEQDKEPINEKTVQQKSKNGSFSGLQVQLTPEMAMTRQNWNSRFSNIKQSFVASEEESKSRSPSVNRQSDVEKNESMRGRPNSREIKVSPRSKSAHSDMPLKEFARINYDARKTTPTISRSKSKEDKGKYNSREACPSENEKEKTTEGHLCDTPRNNEKKSSGRDSVDYQEYLEVISRFRDQNPKVYSRPLQKIPPQRGNIPYNANITQQVTQGLISSSSTQFTPKGCLHDDNDCTKKCIREQKQKRNNEGKHVPGNNFFPAPADKGFIETNPLKANLISGDITNQNNFKETTFVQEGSNKEHSERKSHSMTFQQKPKQEYGKVPKHHDMDYHEYMNIIKKVRKTKEYTRSRFEQMRLASMYAKEKQRQEELKFEEERLKQEREKIEKESEDQKKLDDHLIIPILSSTKHITKKKEIKDRQNETFGEDDKIYFSTSPQNNNPSNTNLNVVPQSFQAFQSNLKEHSKTQEKCDNAVSQMNNQRIEQRKQEEFRELQVKAELEKLEQLRREQLRQEQERQEILMLEQETLNQIQEEQQRLEHERALQEQNIRCEQLLLEQEKLNQEKLQAKRNALYNKQRLDFEAKKISDSYESTMKVCMSDNQEKGNERPFNADQNNYQENVVLQEKLREEHKREEAKIRQEKLNLINKEQDLIAKQEELLRNIEEERKYLAKQEEIIKAQQEKRLQQVRQEKSLLEKQEEMLKMREQQLLQERRRQEQLKKEQQELREQEEAIRKRQEEITKELMLSDLSDTGTGSEYITICQPREGKVFKGRKPILSFITQKQSPNQQVQGEGCTEKESVRNNSLPTDEFYETQVELQQKSTSVPRTVRTIETSIDNPPWAPITPYLNYSEKQNQEELTAILNAPFSQSGIITSPESTRASTTLITSESSLQSQVSQSETSVPSSAQSTPPPLKISEKCGELVNNTNSAKRVNLREQVLDNSQPNIGGPNSAFKPYEGFGSNERAISRVNPMERKYSSDSSMASSLTNYKTFKASRNGSMVSKLSKHHEGNFLISNKIQELRQQIQPPFSATDTESDMRECHLSTLESKTLGTRQKAQKSTYSTSETEEEYQTFVRMRPKWQGKNGHKESWDPLLIDSPPQITQKPLGILQKPNPQPSTDSLISIESGDQIWHNPEENVLALKEYEDEQDDNYDPLMPQLMPLEYDHIQKSDSIIEVRSLGPNNSIGNSKLKTDGKTELINAKNCLSIQEPEPITSIIPWVNSQIEPEKVNHHKSDQIKNMQEKYLENLNSSDSVRIAPFAKIGSDFSQNVSKQAFWMNERNKPILSETALDREKIQHNRTNRTSGAPEMITRKGLKLSQMEEQQMKAKAASETRINSFRANILPREYRSSFEWNSLKNSQSSILEVHPTVIIGNFVPRMPLPKMPETIKELHEPIAKGYQVIMGNDIQSEMLKQKEKPYYSQQACKIGKDDRYKDLTDEEIKGRAKSLKEQRELVIAKDGTPMIETMGTIRNPEKCEEKASNSIFSIAKKFLTKKKLIAEVKPQPNANSCKALLNKSQQGNLEDGKVSHETSKKTEQVSGQENEPTSRMSRSLGRSSEHRPRSKSIGSNLSQRLVELEQDKSRIEESMTLSKTFLPWSSVNDSNNNLSRNVAHKVAILRKRDSNIKKGEINAGYKLRMSKSSDNINATKSLAEDKTGLGMVPLMSKSIGQHLNNFTTSKEDICLILDMAKTCSVSEKVKLFNAQRPHSAIKDNEERERRADEIRREIEEAKAQENKKIISAERVQMQEPVESKVKPLKIPIKPKMMQTSSLERGVPGAKLRINQPAGQEYKSEVKSILRNNRADSNLMTSFKKGLDVGPNDGQTISSQEYFPSLKSRIESYSNLTSNQETEHLVNQPQRRTLSLDRKKVPKLIHESQNNWKGKTPVIYTQSATDHSNTEEDECEKEHTRKNKRDQLDVPSSKLVSNSLMKSKSFAGQFECDIEPSKIDEKQKTILAFFNKSSSQRSRSMERVKENRKLLRRQHSTNKDQDEDQNEQKRENVHISFPPKQCTNKSIMEMDATLKTFDEMFESLLINTFDEKRTTAVFGTDSSYIAPAAQVNSSSLIHVSLHKESEAAITGDDRMNSPSASQKWARKSQESDECANEGEPITQSPSPSQIMEPSRPSNAFSKFKTMDSATPKDSSRSASPSGCLTRQASMPLTVLSSPVQPKSPQTSSGLYNAPRSNVGNLVRSATSAKETILSWVQQTVNQYPNVDVTNFSTSWNDGLAFCALIHNFFPEAFDFHKLDPQHRRYNFTLAFKAAEEYGDICPLLDVDDMVKMRKPDWKSVFTYVQSFYRRFRSDRDPLSSKKTLTMDSSQVRVDPMSRGSIRSQRHEYMFSSKKVIEPFEKFKNFTIKPLPKTYFPRKENNENPSPSAHAKEQSSLKVTNLLQQRHHDIRATSNTVSPCVPNVSPQ